MNGRLETPDGLVHERMPGIWRRTVCEHRHGDRWKMEQLHETDAVTTCLQCLVVPDQRSPSTHAQP